LSDNLQDYTTKVFTPSYILHILQTNRLALKKKLGQNLLINRDAAERTLAYADLHADDRVLEIGPGLGALTFLMAERVEEIVALEVDRGIAAYLSQKVKEFRCSNVCVVHGDFLTSQLHSLPFSKPPNRVVSNFPYSIVIKAMIRITEELRSVESIAGMVQKELADRITASPGNKQYSSVSVYLQYHMDIVVTERRIGPHNFFPRPDVDSSIVLLKRRGMQEGSETGFFKDVVKKAFSNRRKRLVKNIQLLPLKATGSEVESIVMELFKNPGIRAEELSVSDFIHLTEALMPHRLSD
jgi:16S rRNA (adenine1518-N6/adenine1519-N6)-dimethyltransferase